MPIKLCEVEQFEFEDVVLNLGFIDGSDELVAVLKNGKVYWIDLKSLEVEQIRPINDDVLRVVPGQGDVNVVISKNGSGYICDEGLSFCSAVHAGIRPIYGFANERYAVFCDDNKCVLVEIKRPNRVLWEREVGVVMDNPLIAGGNVFVPTDDGLYVTEVEGKRSWVLHEGHYVWSVLEYRMFVLAVGTMGIYLYHPKDKPFVVYENTRALWESPIATNGEVVAYSYGSGRGPTLQLGLEGPTRDLEFDKWVLDVDIAGNMLAVAQNETVWLYKLKYEEMDGKDGKRRK